MSTSINCRFITSPYVRNEHGEEYGEAAYLRKEDVVRLIREINIECDASTDMARLADTLEGINR